MKKIVSLTALAALPLLTAHAQTLADWTFETSQPLGATAPNTAFTHLTPESGISTSAYATGLHAGPSVYTTPVGDGSPHSFSSTNWVAGDYYKFYVQAPTAEAGISLSFDQASSGTGPGSFTLETSTDGVTFNPFTTYTVLVNGSPNTVWNSTTHNSAFTFTYNLGATFGSSTDLYFELVDNASTTPSGGTVGTAGTDRVDNFDVTVSPVPEPATTAMCLLGGVASLFAMRRRS